MRILWHSNSPWSHGGYGTQTNAMLWRLQALGHTLACSCFFGLQGGPLTFNGIPFLPVGRNQYGNDTLANDAAWWKADIVITLMDVWVLAMDVTSKFRWCPWMPVDHDPAPPIVREVLKTAWQPIAYSQWGWNRLREADFDPLYVPHGIDTEIFKPGGREATRARLKINPDTFVAGIVAANVGTPSRKAFDEQFRAFAIFHKRHPDSLLYLHTLMDPPDSEDLWRMLEDSGIPEGAFKIIDQYQYARALTKGDDMANVYAMLDVLMNVSHGEGFGLPIVEAQACGTPVIVGNWTSMPELVGAGWVVEDGMKFRTAQMSYQWMPTVEGIVEALEKAYNARGRQKFRDQARNFAVKNYDADLVVKKYWKPALELIEERINATNHRKPYADIPVLEAVKAE